MKKVKITTGENGPYKVENIKKLENSSGVEIISENEAYLCRCGGSSNKPFCDKTHETNGFTGENKSEYMKNETIEYKGSKITIYDNRNICSHRGYCTSELPKVFKETAPWIDPNGDTVENIIKQCNRCPSGALSYALNNGSRVMGEECIETTIRLSEKHYGFHGPYDVKGDIELSGQISRKPESPIKATLCRCGHSKNKPYCSGEHFHIGFIDDQNE